MFFFLPLKYFYFEKYCSSDWKKNTKNRSIHPFLPLTMNAAHTRIPVSRIPYYYYYSQKCPSHSNGLLPLHKKAREKNHAQSGSGSRLFSVSGTTMEGSWSSKIKPDLHIRSLLFTKCRISLARDHARAACIIYIGDSDFFTYILPGDVLKKKKKMCW